MIEPSQFKAIRLIQDADHELAGDVELLETFLHDVTTGRRGHHLEPRATSKVLAVLCRETLRQRDHLSALEDVIDDRTRRWPIRDRIASALRDLAGRIDGYPQ